MNAIDIKDIKGLSGTYSVKFGKEVMLMEVGVIIRFKKYLYLSKRQALEKGSSLFAQSVGNVGQRSIVMRIEKNLNVEAV